MNPSPHRLADYPPAPLAAVTGASGFIGRHLVVALARSGWRTRLLLRREPDVPQWRELRPERQLAWAVLAVIGVHSLLEYPLWYGPFQVAALLCLWVLRVFAVAPSAERATRWGARAALAGAAIALACAGAGWSYWRVSQPYLPPAERAAPFRTQSWAQLRDTWLFSDQVDFAELAVTPVTPGALASLAPW